MRACARVLVREDTCVCARMGECVRVCLSGFAFVCSCLRAHARAYALRCWPAAACPWQGPGPNAPGPSRHGSTWTAQWPTETGTNNNTNVSLGPPVWSLTPPLTGRLRDQACPGRRWPGCEWQPEWQPEWPATARQVLVVVSMRMWTSLSHDRLTTRTQPERHCRRDGAYSRKPLQAST